MKAIPCAVIFFSLLFLFAQGPSSSVLCKPPGTRYNQVRQISSHNSYNHDNYKLGVYEQAGLGVRSFEFDLHVRKDAPEADWNIYHVGEGKKGDHCGFLSECLGMLRQWHNDHPRHEVITVWLQVPKEWEAGGHLPAELDRRLEQDFGEIIYTPAEMLKTCPQARNLQKMVSLCGWPELEALRDRFIFVLMGSNEGCLGYLKASGVNGNCFIALEGQACQEVEADSNIVFRNFSLKGAEDAHCFSEKGFVTRIYGKTSAWDWNASIESQEEYDAALKSGAHHIATDRAVNGLFLPLLRDERGNPFRLMEE